MKRFTTFLSILLGSASAAMAGPVEVPPPPPPVYVEPERCTLAFDCFYIGLEIGHSKVTGFGHEDGDPPEDFDIDASTVFGAFAGYNFQNGSMIYGGEVRYLHLDIDDPVTGFTMDSVLDLRARLGTALGENFMLYGAVGFSTADATGAANIDMTGFNFGVGAEYNISESFFLGLDLTGRQLEGSTAGFDYEADVNTLTLRAGLRF